MQGYEQCTCVPHGIGGSNVVLPHEQVSSSNEAFKHGPHLPLWSGSMHLWTPHDSVLPQTSSQVCHIRITSSGTAICVSNNALRLPRLSSNSRSGQHLFIHSCLPQRRNE